MTELFPFTGSELLGLWLFQGVAMMLTAAVIPRLTITSLFGPLLAVAVLALINTTVWDAALFLSVPNSLTMHVFSLILVNGLIFWIVVKILPGIEVSGLLPAIAAPIVFSVLSVLVHEFGRDVDWAAVGESAYASAINLREYFQKQQ